MLVAQKHTVSACLCMLGLQYLTVGSTEDALQVSNVGNGFFNQVELQGGETNGVIGLDYELCSVCLQMSR